MSKTTRRSFRYYNYEETDTFTAYLNEMAGQGWFLKKMGFGLLFEKGDPEEACYDVQVFPKGKEEDLKPEEDALDMADLCAGAGWQLVDGRQKFCVYRKTDPTAVPIVTPEEKYQNIRKASLKQPLTNFILFGLLAAMNILEVFCLNPADFLLNGLELTITAGWVMMCLLSLGRILYLSVLMHKWKNQLNVGQEPFYGHLNSRGKTSPQILRYLFSYCAVVIILYVTATYTDTNQLFAPVLISCFTILAISFVLSELKPGRISKIRLASIPIAVIVISIVIILANTQFVVDDDTVISEEASPEEDDSEEETALEREAEEVLLLTGSDYMTDREADLDYYDYNETHSILGSEISGDLSYFDEDYYISYNLYKCRYSWTCDIIWNQLIAGEERDIAKGHSPSSESAAGSMLGTDWSPSEECILWDADALAFYYYDSWYIRKGNCIFYFYSSEVPDKEERARMARAIGFKS